MKLSRLVGVCWLVGCLATAGTTLGQECVSGPTVLPGISGPPDWFGTAGATDWRPELNDPRWAAATSRPFFTYASTPTTIGSLEEALYRVLYHNGSIYVSVQMLVDPSVDVADLTDYVYFGFTKGSLGNNAWVVGVRPNRDGASPVAAPAPTVPQDTPLPYDTNAGTYVDWYETADYTAGAATAWTAHPGQQPPFLLDVATWREAFAGTWAMTFRIDAASLGIAVPPPPLPAPGPLRLFVGSRRAHGVGELVGFGSSALVADADTVGYSVADGAVTLVPKNATTWREFTLPGFGTCAAGASISSGLIGVLSGGSLTSAIQGCSTAPGCTPPSCTPCPAAPGKIENTFRARVQNVPATGLDHSVRAKFRIAEWGSTIADWKFAPFQNIPGIPDTVFTDPLTAFTEPPWDWSFTSGGGPGTPGEAVIDFTCSAAPGSYCPTLTNADGYKHQCMLVELASAPGAGISFTTSAAYRNMNFVGLSKAEVPATISIEGLKQVTGQAVDRDVYLYVETRNMPEHGDKPLWLKHTEMAQAKRYAEAPPLLPPQPRPRVPDKPGGKPTPEKPVPQKPAGAVPAPKEKQIAVAPKPPAPPGPAPGKPGPAEVEAGKDRVISKPPQHVLDVPVLTAEQAMGSAWPTYKVHVYYDTGRTTKVKGREYKIIEPMVPFGYYLDHEGPLYGFTHALSSAGNVQVKELAANYYRIRVGSEQAIKVSTRFNAEESPKGQAPCENCAPCPQCPPPVDKGGICNCRVVRPLPGDSGGVGAGLLLGMLAALRRRFRAGRPQRST